MMDTTSKVWGKTVGYMVLACLGADLLAFPLIAYGIRQALSNMAWAEMIGIVLRMVLCCGMGTALCKWNMRHAPFPAAHDRTAAGNFVRKYGLLFFLLAILWCIYSFHWEVQVFLIEHVILFDFINAMDYEYVKLPLVRLFLCENLASPSALLAYLLASFFYFAAKSRMRVKKQAQQGDGSAGPLIPVATHGRTLGRGFLASLGICALLLMGGCGTGSRPAPSPEPPPGAEPTPSGPPAQFFSVEALAASLIIDSLAVNCYTEDRTAGDAYQPSLVFFLSYHFDCEGEPEIASDFGVEIKFPDSVEEAIGISQTGATVYAGDSKTIYTGELLFGIASPQITEAQVASALAKDSRFEVLFYDYHDEPATVYRVVFQGDLSEIEPGMYLLEDVGAMAP